MKNIFTACLLLMLFPAFAQQQIIDLARNVNITHEKMVTNDKEFAIYIENKLPFKEYNISIAKKAIPMEAFQLPSHSGPANDGIRKSSEDVLCDQYMHSIYDIYSLEREEQLMAVLPDIRKALKDVENQGISRQGGCMNQFKMMANETLELTRSKIWENRLKGGEQLEVTISRVENGEIRTWTQVYKTEPRGEWRASYGFTFITHAFHKEDKYYAALREGEYIIEKENNRRSMDFAPSIFFTWIPTKTINRTFSLGMTGGIGFDFENPTVFLGPTVSYNQNLSLHAGIVAHKQDVLLGKYSEGQVINENLDSAQLHEQLYRINPFVSVSFRFSQNPFQRME